MQIQEILKKWNSANSHRWPTKEKVKKKLTSPRKSTQLFNFKLHKNIGEFNFFASLCGCIIFGPPHSCGTSSAATKMGKAWDSFTGPKHGCHLWPCGISQQWINWDGYLKAYRIFCYKRHLTKASFLLKVAEGGTTRDWDRTAERKASWSLFTARWYCMIDCMILHASLVLFSNTIKIIWLLH